MQWNSRNLPYCMHPYTAMAESPFNEAEEQELAAELLAATSDEALDHFLGTLLRRAASAAGAVLRPRLGRALGSLAKGAVRKILPGAGSGLDAVFTGGAGASVGQLAAGAGRLLGMEAEGLSAEDQEFMAAQQLVRLTGAAAAEASRAEPAAPANDVARQSLITAAHTHAPGLLAPTTSPAAAGTCACGCGGKCAGKPAASGAWEWRGRRIVLHGV